MVNMTLETCVQIMKGGSFYDVNIFLRLYLRLADWRQANSVVVSHGKNVLRCKGEI